MCCAPCVAPFCCALSGAISGRRPFGRDVLLDYEVESDQDWEEEPEGESLSVRLQGPLQGQLPRARLLDSCRLCCTSKALQRVAGPVEDRMHPLISHAGTACFSHMHHASLLSCCTCFHCTAAAATAAANAATAVLSLSLCQADEDGEEECDGEGDEDEEGFVVGDGYLSDDEGMRDDDEPLGEWGTGMEPCV